MFGLEKCALYKCEYPRDLVLPTTMCRECLISTVVTLGKVSDIPLMRDWVKHVITEQLKDTDEQKQIWRIVDWIIKYEESLIRLDTANMKQQGY